MTLHGPKAAKPGTCNACDQPILWAVDNRRRWVALEPDPSPTGSHAYLGDNRALRLADFGVTTSTVPRHAPHSVGCGS